MTIAARIIAYMKDHPNARNREIAAATGAKSRYVSVVRGRIEMTRKHRHRFDIRGALARAPDVRDWLFREKPDDVEVGDFIVAILRDAMYEDQKP